MDWFIGGWMDWFIGGWMDDIGYGWMLVSIMDGWMIYGWMDETLYLIGGFLVSGFFPNLRRVIG
jgi:hypothetical protein